MYTPLRFALRCVPRHVDILRLDITAFFREVLAQLRHQLFIFGLVHDGSTIQNDYVVKALLQLDIVPKGDS